MIENESGRIEEITSTYVVVRLWDMRRMIVPLTYFIEKPFQNWTRDTANQIGAVHLNVDYTAPVDRVRQKAEEIVKASPLWDGNLVKLHVTDADNTSMQLRVIASARSPGDAFDLRCEIREKLIGFLQAELPQVLPRQRQQTLTPPAPDGTHRHRHREPHCGSGSPCPMLPCKITAPKNARRRGGRFRMIRMLMSCAALALAMALPAVRPARKPIPASR